MFDRQLVVFPLLFFARCLYALGGPIAQWLEQSAHNREVPGSNPGGPTT